MCILFTPEYFIATFVLRIWGPSGARSEKRIYQVLSSFSDSQGKGKELTVTEKMFQMKYMQRLAALQRTVTVALHRVGSALSLGTSFFSDSMYLYKYHSCQGKKQLCFIFCVLKIKSSWTKYESSEFHQSGIHPSENEYAPVHRWRTVCKSCELRLDLQSVLLLQQADLTSPQLTGPETSTNIGMHDFFFGPKTRERRQKNLNFNSPAHQTGTPITPAAQWRHPWPCVCLSPRPLHSCWIPPCETASLWDRPLHSQWKSSVTSVFPSLWERQSTN